MKIGFQFQNRMMRLYVHVPFCLSKCYYCNFYSVNRPEFIPAYLHALRNEFRSRLPFFMCNVNEEVSSTGGSSLHDSDSSVYNFSGFGGFSSRLSEDFWSLLSEEDSLRAFNAYVSEKSENAAGISGVKFASIYIGGGTPSVLSPPELDELLGMFDGLCAGEYTVEMNPDTVTAEKIDVLRKHGVNRVSLGVQSTDDSVLRAIGRTHDLQTVIRALDLLNYGGITNLSLDFISGFFGQDGRDADRFVRIASKYATHVSAYALEYSGTKLSVLDDDAERTLFYGLKKRLEAAGFERYEISNFAKKDFYSRHNSAYWRGEAYLGLGPGAVSFDGNRRIQCRPDMKRYLTYWGREEMKSADFSSNGTPLSALSSLSLSSSQSLFFESVPFSSEEELKSQYAALYSTEVLTPFDHLVEDLILPLRTCCGVSLSSYYEKYGIDLQKFESVKTLLEGGLLNIVPFRENTEQSEALCFTDRGFDLSNFAYTMMLEELEKGRKCKRG